jgi:hypothetical protein
MNRIRHYAKIRAMQTADAHPIRPAVCGMLVREGEAAVVAWECAGVLAEWDELEAAGVVRHRVEPDEDYDWKDLRDEVKAGTMTQDEFDRIADMGAWGTIAEWRGETTDDEGDELDEDEGWEQADSCWGHAGYSDPADPHENCYVLQEYSAAIKAYRDWQQEQADKAERAEWAETRGSD